MNLTQFIVHRVKFFDIPDEWFVKINKNREKLEISTKKKIKSELKRGKIVSNHGNATEKLVKIMI